MWPTVIAGISALVGILIGGGVRAWEAQRSRRLDGDSLLAALSAEVEALTRLIDHRQFIQVLTGTGYNAFEMVKAGRGMEEADFITIYLRHNYFSVFDASAGKIGLLHPYVADRITRFYTYVKAASENYHPDSPFQRGVTAAQVVDIINSDLQLLNTALVLGRHIATFRDMTPPPNIIDPFVIAPDQEPSMPVAAVAPLVDRST